MAVPTKSVFALLFLFGAFDAVAAGPESQPARAAIEYKGAAAHDGRFADKALWPRLTGKEAFSRESWAPGRLVAWAHPGKEGRPAHLVKGGALNSSDLSNWVESQTGKPPAEMWDENTDMLIPASDTPYRVEIDKVSNSVRHLTIQRNASLKAGEDNRGFNFHGNVWVQQGGALYIASGTRLVGPKHSFYRNDDVRHRCSQHYVFAKDKDVSVEVIGHVTMLDEFRIAGCTAIVGVDSKLQPGRNASPIILGGGTLALMDGAYFGLWANNLDNRDLEVTGTIQGGLPDRPLTRNCIVGLNFKNFTKAPFEAKTDADKKLDHFVNTRVASLVLYPGSALRSYSADLSKARLVVTWNGNVHSKFRPAPGSDAEKTELERSPGKKRLYEWFDSLPQAIDIYFGKDTAVDGVEFDRFHAGGLMLEDPSAKDGWKNVFFGGNNLAQPEALFTHATKIQRGGVY